MLRITDAAEAAMRRIREDNGGARTAALRIGVVDTPAGGVVLGFSITEGPEEGDQMISEKDDFRVYLTKELAISLADAAIDATSSEEGVALELHTGAELLAHERHDRPQQPS